MSYSPIEGNLIFSVHPYTDLLEFTDDLHLNEKYNSILRNEIYTYYDVDLVEARRLYGILLGEISKLKDLYDSLYIVFNDFERIYKVYLDTYNNAQYAVKYRINRILSDFLERKSNRARVRRKLESS